MIDFEINILKQVSLHITSNLRENRMEDTEILVYKFNNNEQHLHV